MAMDANTKRKTKRSKKNDPLALAAWGQWIQKRTAEHFEPIATTWSQMLGIPNGQEHQPTATSRSASYGAVVDARPKNALAAALRSRGGAKKVPKELESRDRSPVTTGSINLPIGRSSSRGSPVPPLPIGDGNDGKRRARSSTGCSRRPPTRSPTTSSSGKPEATFAGQLDEFLHRGTPRVGSRSQPPLARLEQRLACWAHRKGIPGREAPRLCGLRPVQSRAPQFTDANDALEPTMHSQEACVIWRGVEITLDLAITSHIGASPHADQNIEDIIVCGAQTACNWDVAQRSVHCATRDALWAPLEMFLDALLEKWLEDEDVKCTTASGWPQDMTPLDSLRYGTKTGETNDGLQESPECKSPDSSCASSRRGSIVPPGGFAESFQEFLADRPPLWRFQHCSTGLAWEYPPSKAEKHELLLLQIMAQEEELRTEMQQLQTKQSRLSSASTAASRVSSA